MRLRERRRVRHDAVGSLGGAVRRAPLRAGPPDAARRHAGRDDRGHASDGPMGHRVDSEPKTSSPITAIWIDRAHGTLWGAALGPVPIEDSGAAEKKKPAGSAAGRAGAPLRFVRLRDPSARQTPASRGCWANAKVNAAGRPVAVLRRWDAALCKWGAGFALLRSGTPARPSALWWAALARDFWKRCRLCGIDPRQRHAESSRLLASPALQCSVAARRTWVSSRSK
jgi:hypothetical protein